MISEANAARFDIWLSDFRDKNCGQHPTPFEAWQASREAMMEELNLIKREARFRQLYESLAEEYHKENTALYCAIAPYLDLHPYYGKYNKEQVIWAKSQDQANSLPAGASIFQFVKEALLESSHRFWAGI